MSVKSLTLNDRFPNRVVSASKKADSAGAAERFLEESATVLDLETARIAHIVPAPHRTEAQAYTDARRLRAVYFRWVFRLIGDGLRKLIGRR